MTKEKLKSVFAQYELYMEVIYKDVPAKQLSEAETDIMSSFLGIDEKRAHIKFMCVEGGRLVDQGRIEKAMR